MDGGDGSAWSRIDAYDGSAALIATVLELDPDEAYTRKELSERADVCYKTLYLEVTVQAVVELGLLNECDTEPEQTFTPAVDAPIYEAASRFADAARSQRRDPMQSS